MLSAFLCCRNSFGEKKDGGHVFKNHSIPRWMLVTLTFLLCIERQMKKKFHFSSIQFHIYLF